MFDVFLSSLQLHASDCPYNSMPRTFGLTRATEIGSRRLTKDTEKFPEKERKENKLRKGNFQNSAVLQNFEKSPTSYLVG